jgi:hypothetical protein
VSWVSERAPKGGERGRHTSAMLAVLVPVPPLARLATSPTFHTPPSSCTPVIEAALLRDLAVLWHGR